MQPEAPQGLHVAIIMDGNGRWAMRRGLPRIAGHRAGVAALRRVVERAPDVGITCLTVYAFSSDNWRRPASEVQGIFWLLRAFLRLETERLRQRGARLQVIGQRDRLAKSVLREIDKAECATTAGCRLHLRVAVDYSSRDAITRAAIVAIGGLDRGLPPHESLGVLLTQALIAQCGDVDLLIRTGGEKRLSDFLLWESAYAELIFTDTMWPDFDESDLESALEEFGRRERRFGGVPATILYPGPEPMDSVPRSPSMKTEFIAVLPVAGSTFSPLIIYSVHNHQASRSSSPHSLLARRLHRRPGPQRRHGFPSRDRTGPARVYPSFKLVATDLRIDRAAPVG